MPPECRDWIGKLFARELTSLHTLATTLDKTVYPALEKAYPRARIVHVGYPRLSPPAGQPLQVMQRSWRAHVARYGGVQPFGEIIVGHSDNIGCLLEILIVIPSRGEAEP